MDTRRFNKIKSLNDLKLEKARLRYELLMIENQLNEDISSIEKLASLTAVFSRITHGIEMGQKIYDRIVEIISKFRSSTGKKKKKKKKHNDNHESE